MSLLKLTTTLSKKEYTLSELELYAANLACGLKAENVVCLYGDLGVGKTAFARALVNAFVANAEVTSPTFNLVHKYSAAAFDIWHFDLYRIKSPSELLYLGLEEALLGLSIIEWPEVAVSLLPNRVMKINIAFTNNADTRFIEYCDVQFRPE